MGKFTSNSNFFQPTRFSNPIDTSNLSPYGVQMANIRSIPVWELEGISEQEYLARQNALVYDASFIEMQILETVQNDIDPITDESIISMIQHEDEETINILEK
jgi:hypothetical protein